MGKPQPLEFPKDRRKGDIYLDQVEAEQAEIVRAKREGRQPDLKNLPHHVGSQVKVLPDNDEFAPGHFLGVQPENKESAKNNPEKRNVPTPPVTPEPPVFE